MAATTFGRRPPGPARTSSLSRSRTASIVQAPVSRSLRTTTFSPATTRSPVRAILFRRPPEPGLDPATFLKLNQIEPTRRLEDPAPHGCGREASPGRRRAFGSGLNGIAPPGRAHCGAHGRAGRVRDGPHRNYAAKDSSAEPFFPSRSRRSARSLSWRIRSRVTPSMLPISSRVCSHSPSSPK